MVQQIMRIHRCAVWGGVMGLLLLGGSRVQAEDTPAAEPPHVVVPPVVTPVETPAVAPVDIMPIEQINEARLRALEVELEAEKAARQALQAEIESERAMRGALENRLDILESLVKALLGAQPQTTPGEQADGAAK